MRAKLRAAPGAIDLERDYEYKRVEAPARATAHGGTLRMERFVWICVGGAAGTGLRYLASGWMLRALGPAFPYGTLAVNVVGSLVLGLLMHLGMTTEWMSPTLRLALTTGLMGGLTTYSTFSFETMRLIEEGAWGLALLNVALTLFVCLGASFGGVLLGRLIAGS